MPDHAEVLEVDHAILGPWSLESRREFWEGFIPAALPGSGGTDEPRLRTVFLAEADHRPVEVLITQTGTTAHLVLRGRGDLPATVPQVLRFVSLDVDARDWPDVAHRDDMIAAAQARFPGLRPCGFHPPYEAAAWSVLSPRIQMRQAAKLQRDLVDRHGEDGTRWPNATARTAPPTRSPTRGAPSGPGPPSIYGSCETDPPETRSSGA